MMLAKTERMNELLDWYHMLLTERQQLCMSLYYYEDYSLAEIAENLSISRSAVFDLLKRTEVILEDYEEKLHCVSNYRKRNKMYVKIRSLNVKAVNSLIDELEEIEKD